MKLSASHFDRKDAPRRKYLRGWRKELVKEGFGLGPFAFVRDQEAKVWKEMPFPIFQARVKARICERNEELELPEAIVEWVYDLCIQARVERELVETARKLVRGKQWRLGERSTRRLVNLLSTYDTFDSEKALQRALCKGVRSQTGRASQKLVEHLLSLLEVNRGWRRWSNWPSWRADFRGYIVAMDRGLKKRLPNLSKKQRADLISDVLEEIGLMEAASAEGISKMLQRESRKRRRSGAKGL